MVKKCIVCGEDAVYCIKDSSEFYCKECAEENFGDVEMLKTIDEAEKQAKEIKRLVKSDEENQKEEE